MITGTGSKIQLNKLVDAVVERSSQREAIRALVQEITGVKLVAELEPTYCIGDRFRFKRPSGGSDDYILALSAPNKAQAFNLRTGRCRRYAVNQVADKYKITKQELVHIFDTRYPENITKLSSGEV